MSSLQRQETFLQKIPLWGWISLAYMLSRLAFYHFGIRWDSTFLSWGWQALDIRWMQEDLARSIWYLHSQPPLFNLGVGLVIKIAPESYDLILQTIFRLMGLAMFISMGAVLRGLGVRKAVAFAAVLFFLLSPSSVVYENWLFYSHPTVCLLSFCAFALMKLVQTRQVGWSFAFSMLLVCVVLTRSLFQWFWLVAILAALLLVLRNHRKVLLKGSAIPLLLLFGFLLKNMLVFGFLGTSSWGGMNLGRIAFLGVPLETKVKMVDAGQLPPVCTHNTFQSISTYKGDYVSSNPHPDVPILTDSTAHGTINFHHWDFLEISRQYGIGSKAIVLRQPANYVRNVAVATSYWFQPPSSYGFIQEKTQKLNGYNRIWNYATMGTLQNPEDVKPPGEGTWDQKRTVTMLVALVYAFVFVVVLRTALRNRKRVSELDPATLAVSVYCFLTIGYIFTLSTMTEVGENMRFRFLTLPLGWILMGIIVEHLLCKLAARKAARQAPSSAS